MHIVVPAIGKHQVARVLVPIVGFVLLLVFPVSAISAGICPIDRYSVGATDWYIFGMIRGTDSNVWFVKPVASSSYDLANITLDGTRSEFPVAGVPVHLAITSDHAVWYTRSDSGLISQLTLSDTVNSFPISSTQSNGIAVGADGNLWITESSSNQIERVTPTGAVTGQFTIPTADSGPDDIILGGDGNLWFIESAAKKIGYISITGDITEFSTLTPSAELTHIVAGPDGNVWFVETVACSPYCSYSYYDRITPAGTITQFGPTLAIDGIVVGADGNLWTTLRWYFNYLLGRITMDGNLSSFGSPSTDAFRDHPGNALAAGGDGKLWIGTGGYTDQSIEVFDPNKLGCFAYLPLVGK